MKEKTIGIVCAMRAESDRILALIETPVPGKIAGKETICGSMFGMPCALVTCGVGKVNAALAAQAVLDKFHPAFLVNCGIAGGINPKLNAGDTVLVTRAAQYDFDLSAVNDCPVGLLEEFDDVYIPSSLPPALSDLLPYEAMNLATGDRFSENTDEIRFLREELRADLRDMEGAAVFQVAHYNRIPLLCFKTVADRVDADAVSDYYAKKQLALSELERAATVIFSMIANQGALS